MQRKHGEKKPGNASWKLSCQLNIHLQVHPDYIFFYLTLCDYKAKVVRNYPKNNNTKSPESLIYGVNKKENIIHKKNLGLKLVYFKCLDKFTNASFKIEFQFYMQEI